MRWIKLGLPLTILFLGACDDAPPPAAPLPEVFVVTASEQPYQPERTFTARIDSRSDVNITAQVSGKLTAVHFREGDNVEAGAPLFDIDPAPYEAALARAQAEHERARATLADARNNLDRAGKLIDKGYISDSEYDTLKTRKLEAEAAEQSARAALESARVDLSYTRISAPQAGRVGRSIASVGDVVSPGFGTLTTLVGGNDMQAVFQIPERLLTDAAMSENQPKPSEIEVGLEMPNGSDYPYTGNIVYVSNRVDSHTGTLEVRAAMPNPRDLLRPGMFVQAHVRLKESLQGLMIPQAALQVDQQGTYVFTVNKENRVLRNNLMTGDRFGENVLVSEGLQVGDRVILRGIQKVRAGSEVKALDYKPATTPHAGSQPAPQDSATPEDSGSAEQ
ncbi:efflux RND transporter periplasmic adaptor subunit [Alcanivorax sp. S6407]|uniref:efflux RND transporter periplasmic adaptor subunit n=1 Tax=Alcanivorax sp. S6407 TaxID=2926424 RepID=UPI001FF14566|nr:efflux RND transporter periplasmic adaptor subunit [Alcanivorax sp. S6407]MCK0154362.1 efflux RND transporter periplasmic adaptor subunit [Alcanivorax sp. S6407]